VEKCRLVALRITYIVLLQNIEAGRRKAKELVEGYKTQVKFLQEERERSEGFRLEADRTRKQLEQYKSIQLVLAGSEGEVNRMLHDRGAFDGKSRDLATLIVEMKKKIVDLKRERTLYEQRAHDATRQADEARRQLKAAQAELQESRLARSHLEADHQAVLAQNQDLLRRQKERKAHDFHAAGGSQEGLDSSSYSSSQESPADRNSVSSSEPRLVTLDLSDVDTSPGPPLKSCGIILGEKRKPLTEARQLDGGGGKRLRLGANIYENFQMQPHRDEKVKQKFRKLFNANYIILYVP